jgi:hypothetical protein
VVLAIKRRNAVLRRIFFLILFEVKTSVGAGVAYKKEVKEKGEKNYKI